jgi:tetratricopeptide (TPR) repeat protein
LLVDVHLKTDANSVSTYPTPTPPRLPSTKQIIALLETLAPFSNPLSNQEMFLRHLSTKCTKRGWMTSGWTAQIPRLFSTTTTTTTKNTDETTAPPTAAEIQIDNYLNAAWEANLNSNFEASAIAFRKAMVKQTQELGSQAEATLLSKNNLGAALLNNGCLDEAELILRECLLERIQVLGDDSAATLTTANNLGILLKQMGQLEEAEAMSKRAFVGSLTAMGPAHEDVLDTAQNYGEILVMVGKIEQCERLFSQMQNQCERNFGVSHPNTQKFIQNAAILKEMKEQKEREEAEK